MVSPGFSFTWTGADHALSSGRSATASVCALRQAASRVDKSAGSFSASTARRQQCGVDGAGLADRQRADRECPAGICTIE